MVFFLFRNNKNLFNLKIHIRASNKARKLPFFFGKIRCTAKERAQLTISVMIFNNYSEQPRSWMRDENNSFNVGAIGAARDKILTFDSRVIIIQRTGKVDIKIVITITFVICFGVNGFFYFDDDAFFDETRIYEKTFLTGNSRRFLPAISARIVINSGQSPV